MKIAKLIEALGKNALTTSYMGTTVGYNENWISAIGEKVVGFKLYTGPEVFPEPSHYGYVGDQEIEMLDNGQGAVVAKCEDGLFEAIFEEVDINSYFASNNW